MAVMILIVLIVFLILFLIGGFLYFKAKNKEKEKAISELTQSGNKEQENSYLDLGLANFGEERYEKALEHFEKILKLNPQRTDVSFYIAKCKDEMCGYEADEDGQSIISEYLKLEEKGELLPSFQITLAKAYAKNGQLKEALARCKKALAVNERDVESYKLMGLIQLIQKDSKGAKETLSKSLGLDMKDMEAHDILSYVLCQYTDSDVVKKCRCKYLEIIKKQIKIT